MKCLVTGATGFVGSALMAAMARCGHQTTALVRRLDTASQGVQIPIKDITDSKTLVRAVVGQEVVIHLANRAHVFKQGGADSLADFRSSNVDGTLALARQAMQAGVKRFIYLSSIKVNGARTYAKAFRYDDPPAPPDPYAISKWEAEQGLRQLCAKSAMELVIIRPPLVYGPGAKGNLKTLAKAIDKGWPLPLAQIHNRRDLMSLYNLIDLIETCISHPNAAGQTFLCCDENPVSTSELVTWIAKARNKKPRLFTFPAALLTKLLALTGGQALCDRLLGDLRVDMGHTKELLEWTPPVPFDAAVLRAFAVNAELSRVYADD